METKISMKSRNLGIGWSKEPFGNTVYPSNMAEEPAYSGGVRTLEEGLAEITELNTAAGDIHNVTLFVGKRPVVGVWHIAPETSPESDEIEGFKETWVRMNISDIVSRLRQGETLKVKLKE
jgi:hypothetical protein